MLLRALVPPLAGVYLAACAHEVAEPHIEPSDFQARDLGRVDALAPPSDAAGLTDSSVGGPDGGNLVDASSMNFDVEGSPLDGGPDDAFVSDGMVDESDAHFADGFDANSPGPAGFEPGGPCLTADERRCVAGVQWQCDGGVWVARHVCETGCLNSVVCNPFCGDGVIGGDETCDPAIPQGCTQCIDCRQGFHISINSSDQNYAEFDDSDRPLTLAGVHFSIEAWGRVAGQSGRIDVDRRGPQSTGWRFGFSTAGLHASVFGLIDMEAPVVIEPDRWYHAAWSFDGERHRFWLDGQLVRRFDNRHAPRASAVATTIGGLRNADSNVRGYSDGSIDEVRISSVSRYQAPFAPARRLESDLDTMALWHLDEGQGDSVRDTSGRGHHGILRRAQIWGLDQGYGPAYCGP